MTRHAAAESSGEPAIAYDVTGDGPEPVLLIAGLADTRLAWTRQLELLGEQHRAITFDNRDMGASDPSPREYSTLTMAHDALRVLDAAGVDSAHVVGHSLGGMAAQWLAITAPERVRALVLSCTYSTPGPYCERLVEALRAVLDAQGTRALRRLLLLWGFDPDLVEAYSDDVAGAERVIADEDPGVGAVSRQLEALAGHDTTGRLAEITCPTTVIAGVGDRIVPARRTRDLRFAIPDAVLEDVPGGHACFWTSPEVYTRALTVRIEQAAALPGG